jgi:outer membrane protein OmpA-like peptidoglycan-associated protein
LFFASNRIGGFGGMDIYYSIKNSRGEWERSQNLGPMINTALDDDGPFIDYDGKTLYFSSQGRTGMGGHDVFYSVYDSASRKWSEPVNLGYPINTPDNDIYFVSTKDGKRGYYASVREDGYGFTDIYMVTVEKPEGDQTITSRGSAYVGESNEAPLQPVTLTIKVMDGETKEMLNANVSLRRRSDNVMAGILSKGKGIFESNITNASESTYQLSVEEDGYSFQNKNIDIPAASAEGRELVQIIEMNKLRVGTGSVLRNIYFNFNKATFQPSSLNELSKLERMMQQNPGLRIRISGHTDRIGSASYNKKLSQQRANAVKNYLVKKGVDPRRVQSIGYGEESPLASNDDELEGRELNRRVEFEVIH